MARNVEVKARLRDRALTERVAAELSGGPGELLVQEDTFFECGAGRLKLRAVEGRPAEVIFYRRPDLRGPKTSDYSVARVEDGRAMKLLLASALGEAGTVRKRRTLYVAGRTRIHLDAVEGLGNFLELECVLRPGEAPSEGEREVRALLPALGVEESDLLEGAYLDLLAEGLAGTAEGGP